MRLIFVYGGPASGKLTVARELAALAGFALFHNHLVVDAVAAVFPFGSAPFIRLRESMWLTMFREAAEAGRSMIFTFAPESTVEAGFPERAKLAVEASGGEVSFVRLAVPAAEQERRIGNSDRRRFGKLSSLELLRQLRDQLDRCEAAMPEAALTIDTALMSPAAAARLIVDRLGLPVAASYADKPFRKDLSNVSWEQVYARQALRAELVPGWIEALRLKAGDRVIEVGAGPGYVSFALAERVGPSGLVYALDRSAAALAYLDRLKAERGIVQIRTIAADAATWEGAWEGTGASANSALVTMVLHHTDDPAAILANVARLLPAGAPVVIGEFDPNGPCDVGPPRGSRVPVEKLLTWCAAAGLAVHRSLNQTAEHYLVVAERRA